MKTKEETKNIDYARLISMYNSGDPEKMEKALEMACDDLRLLVYSIAHSLNADDKHFADLVQEGLLAICDSFGRYDAGIARPTTYFYYRIKSAMTEYLRVLDNKTKHYIAIASYIRRREQEEGHSVSDSVLAKELSCPTASVTTARKQDAMRTVSINTAEDMPDDENTPESIVEKKMASLCVDREVMSLPNPFRTIICHTYGLCGYGELTDIEIAREMQITVPKVRKLRKIALSDLRTDRTLLCLWGDSGKKKKLIRIEDYL